MEWKDQLDRITDVVSFDEIGEALGLEADVVRSYVAGEAEPTPETETHIAHLDRAISGLGDMPDQEKASWLGHTHEELEQLSAFDVIRAGEGERAIALAEKAGAAYRERAAQEQTF